MHKKVFYGCFILTLLFASSLFSAKVFAKQEYEVKAPYIEARYAVAIDAKSRRILFSKDSHAITPMASTTKIITALVALKYGELDKEVEISERAAGIRGSTVGYKNGQRIQMRELIYGLMLRSGNDAAIAIAEGIGGSVEGFAQLMNEYAAGIGLIDTHFESPHGLDSPMHYTTAYDLAIVTAKAKEIKEFNEIVSSKDIDGLDKGFSRSFHNINKILWQVPEATGVKTGYTGQAGKCLVSSFNKDGNEIIVVVINCTQRWRESKKIFDYVCKEYEYRKVALQNDVMASLNVQKGDSKMDLVVGEDIIIPAKAGCSLDVKTELPKYIKAPIKKNDKIGTLNVYEDGNLIYKCPLYSKNNISKKKSIRDLFKLFR